MTIEELVSRPPWKEHPDGNCHRADGLVLTEIFYATPLQMIVFTYMYKNCIFIGEYDCVSKFLNLKGKGLVTANSVSGDSFLKFERTVYDKKDIPALIESIKDSAQVMEWIPDIKEEIKNIVAPYNVQ